MNRVPGLLRSSRVGLEGDRGEEEADDGGPTSTWRLHLEKRVKECGESEYLTYKPLFTGSKQFSNYKGEQIKAQIKD